MKLKLLFTLLSLNCVFFANSKSIVFFEKSFYSNETISPITASNSGNTCIGSFFNLFCTDAGSGYTYSWSGPGGFTSNEQNPTNVTFSIAGSFMYTVTATNGSVTETASTTIDIFFPFTPTFTPVSPVCSGSIPNLPNVSNDGFSGNWSPNPNVPIFASTIFTFTPDLSQCASPVIMSVIVNPSPTFNQPSNPLNTCDANDGANDGYMIYSLSSLAGQILGSQSPVNYNVTFYESQADAINNQNPIVNTSNYHTYTHPIWFRVTNVNAGCYTVSSFTTTVEQKPEPFITNNPSSNAICVNYITHSVENPLLLQSQNTTSYLINNPQPSYTYQWYEDGTLIPGANSSNYFISFPLNDNSSSVFNVTMENQTALGCYSSSQDFLVIQSGQASPIGIGYSIVNNSGNQTITVECQGYGMYQYSIDGGSQQDSPIFENVSLGTHQITVWDIEGNCNSSVLNNIDVNLTPTPPPTGNTSQSFNQGATLANIQVTGQNIRWYSTVNKNASSFSLPLNTVLVDGQTYFASQKIGGYESTIRFPVTVHLSLNNAEFEPNEVLFSPNPVQDFLYIKADDVINTVKIYNLLGQEILKVHPDSTSFKLAIESLNKGSYFVRINSNDKEKTFKIIKD
jgi:hypothetical protein